MTLQITLSFLIAGLFGAIHLLGDQLSFLNTTPRSAWLSVAGGVSVSYVFVHLLPELAAHQESFRHAAETGGALAAVESHIYVIALTGLLVFYGLERLAKTSAKMRKAALSGPPRSDGAFWLHLGSFALYNMLIGYLLLHREDANLRSFLAYALAMGLHFLVNDHSLRAHHGELYRFGRWLLAAAPFVGLLLGLAVTLSDLAIGALFAFLVGGVVLNVLKEELPEQRESRFWVFAAGTAGYAALLLAPL